VSSEAPEFTAAQIEAGIVEALAQGDLEVVPGMIKLLAAQDPHRARLVMDTIERGLGLAGDDG
jgi:hypothetical protein